VAELYKRSGNFLKEKQRMWSESLSACKVKLVHI